jgi:hypothetical protein
MIVNHVSSVEYVKTFRSEKIAGMFDCAPADKLTRTFSVELPDVDDSWSIGLIVGPSGSGKTTIGQKAYGAENYHRAFDWPQTGSFIEGFPKEQNVKDIVDALSHVGFSSPPHWLLPHHCLSNGQKFRAEMARVVLDERKIVVVDEFTSVIDRDVAKIGSSAIAKLVRSKKKKFVALSCHYDITDWLEPDWVYDFATNTLHRGSLHRRPQITLRVDRCGQEAWVLFAGNHYMSATLNKSAQCWLATWNDVPVAFTAAIRFPRNDGTMTWREHRTVCLPDFQGIGIGNAMSATVARHYMKTGFRYFSTTGHPAMIASRMRSKLWRTTREPGRVAPLGKTSNFVHSTGTSASRLTASFEFIGP